MSASLEEMNAGLEGMSTEALKEKIGVPKLPAEQIAELLGPVKKQRLVGFRQYVQRLFDNFLDKSEQYFGRRINYG